MIAITFERNPDKKKAFKRIADYKAAMKLPYQVLYGGIANKDSASNAFPQVDGIRSFPTMIFLDKTNKIYKIALSIRYERFCLSVNNNLLNTKYIFLCLINQQWYNVLKPLWRFVYESVISKIRSPVFLGSDLFYNFRLWSRD